MTKLISLENNTLQDIYQSTILFASQKHLDHKLSSYELPYLVHLSNVTMEILIAAQHSENFDVKFAVQVALLHDTLEDTDTTFSELEETFSFSVAEAVQALTKNQFLSPPDKMPDSLNRILRCAPEVAAVKLADRITNLQKPPQSWSGLKITNYHQESIQILAKLGPNNLYLAQRLANKISQYRSFFQA